MRQLILCLAIWQEWVYDICKDLLNQNGKGYYIIQRELLGVPHFGKKSPQKGVKYQWILLANEFVQAIAEKSICTQFEENLSTILQYMLWY